MAQEALAFLHRAQRRQRKLEEAAREAVLQAADVAMEQVAQRERLKEVAIPYLEPKGLKRMMA